MGAHGAVPTLVVVSGHLLLWILQCLIQGGAFSRVEAHNQPLSLIAPPLFCNQPTGWDLAGVVGDKPRSKPPAFHRNHCNSYSKVPGTLLLPASCLQPGLQPPPELTQPFPPPQAAAGPFPLPVL